ncbi:MAG: Bro-N domain-containing protein [Alphaproteobacteria bacterium]|nr:Bro-N domain-containing protein [Alphaproteobacteria bacterium]
MKSELKLFEQNKIRSLYDEEKDVWYFSVVDVISILIEKDYQTARNYWKVLKNRLQDEGANETVTKCNQLKMMAMDGKMRETDVADAETMLRLVQSVPSPKAEPIKQWLAKVGYERMKETADPALSLNRARENWQKLGYSDKWIQQRMMGQETRNKLTDYWKDHEITTDEQYAILTNMIHQEWSGLSVRTHKKLKGLKSQNLRDHMSEAELIFTALAELSTRQVAEKHNATGMNENKQAAKIGGSISKRARQDYEQQTGQKVITSDNFLPQKKTKQIKGDKNA